MSSRNAGTTRSMQAGGSTGKAHTGGTFYVTTSAAGNIGASKQTLHGPTIPANMLVNVGDRLVFHAFGFLASNSNTKVLGVDFGATTLISTSTQVANTVWQIDGHIIVDATNDILFVASICIGARSTQTYASGTASITLTSDETLAFTATAPSNNDIQQFGTIIEYYPVPS